MDKKNYLEKLEMPEFKLLNSIKKIITFFFKRKIKRKN